MSNSDAYAQGYAQGWRWAEQDLADAVGSWWEPELQEQLRTTTGEKLRASVLGQLRGYRAAHHAYDTGRLTPSMFEERGPNR